MTEIAPRPSLRQAHKDLSRQRIAAAARGCFYAKGVNETSFEDIAAAAGVRRATVYLHFANKNAILHDLLAENLREVQHLYARLVRLDRVDSGTVRQWILSYVDTLARHQQALRLFHIAGVADDAVRTLIDDYREQVAAVLGERFPAFAVQPATPEAARHYAAAIMTIARVDQFAEVAARPDARVAAAAIIDLLTEELMALLEMA